MSVNLFKLKVIGQFFAHFLCDVNSMLSFAFVQIFVLIVCGIYTHCVNDTIIEKCSTVQFFAHFLCDKDTMLRMRFVHFSIFIVGSIHTRL